VFARKKSKDLQSNLIFGAKSSTYDNSVNSTARIRIKKNLAKRKTHQRVASEIPPLPNEYLTYSQF